MDSSGTPASDVLRPGGGNEQIRTRYYGLCGQPKALDVVTTSVLSSLLHPHCPDPMTLLQKMLSFDDNEEEHLAVVGAITEAGCTPQDMLAAYLHNVRVLHEDKNCTSVPVPVSAEVHLDAISSLSNSLLQEIAKASAAYNHAYGFPLKASTAHSALRRHGIATTAPSIVECLPGCDLALGMEASDGEEGGRGTPAATELDDSSDDAATLVESDGLADSSSLQSSVKDTTLHDALRPLSEVEAAEHELLLACSDGPLELSVAAPGYQHLGVFKAPASQPQMPSPPPDVSFTGSTAKRGCMGRAVRDLSEASCRGNYPPPPPPPPPRNAGSSSGYALHTNNNMSAGSGHGQCMSATMTSRMRPSHASSQGRAPAFNSLELSSYIGSTGQSNHRRTTAQQQSATAARVSQYVNASSAGANHSLCSGLPGAGSPLPLHHPRSTASASLGSAGPTLLQQQQLAASMAAAADVGTLAALSGTSDMLGSAEGALNMARQVYAGLLSGGSGAGSGSLGSAPNPLINAAAAAASLLGQQVGLRSASNAVALQQAYYHNAAQAVPSMDTFTQAALDMATAAAVASTSCMSQPLSGMYPSIGSGMLAPHDSWVTGLAAAAGNMPSAALGTGLLAPPGTSTSASDLAALYAAQLAGGNSNPLAPYRLYSL